MSFKVIYYLSIACPTVEKTLEMYDQYVARGATSFQVDMPSSDPYGETDFIKKMMADALAAHPNYDYYMDAFRKMRAMHPGIELSVVVYKDVMDAIGIEKFAEFCKEIDAFTVRLAGHDEREAYTKVLHEKGLKTVEAIDYYMSEAPIARAREATTFVTMRSKRKTEAPNPGLESWQDRVAHVRERGVTAPIFAVADMKTADNINAAKQGGASGTIVGNALMQLWDQDEAALWDKFAEFQSCVE